MEIIEEGQRDVVLKTKTRKLIDQHFGGCTRIKFIPAEGGRFKQNRRQYFRTYFRRGNVIHTGA
jgi:hypothetical protein